jgi:hypothetical protein
MKKQALFLSLMLVMALSAMTGGLVYAQEPECRDAAGAVIPCPPTKVPPTEPPSLQPTEQPGSGGDDEGSGEEESKSPTSTPLPLANPATDVEKDAKDPVTWSGDCATAGKSIPDITTCVGKLANSCTNSGGSYDIEIKEDKHTVTCTLPAEEYMPDPLPLANPTEETQAAGAEWSGTCKGSVQDITRCIGLFTNGCKHVGGTVSTGEIKNGEVPLTCTVPKIALTPEPAPLVDAPSNPEPAPEPQPAPGGNFPPGGWLPWMAGLGGLLIGLLLPAVQKLADKPENPDEARKIFLGGLSAKPDEPQPQTREHILLANKPDEPATAKSGSGGQKPPPPPSGSPSGRSMEIESWSFGATQNPTDEDGIGREDIIKREDKDKG